MSKPTKPNEDEPLDLLRMLTGGGVDDTGIVCPRCHCRHWHVRNTRQRTGEVRRYRECRNCGHILRTTEKPG